LRGGPSNGPPSPDPGGTSSTGQGAGTGEVFGTARTYRGQVSDLPAEHIHGTTPLNSIAGRRQTKNTEKTMGRGSFFINSYAVYCLRVAFPTQEWTKVGGQGPGNGPCPGTGSCYGDGTLEGGEGLKIQCLFLVYLVPFGDHDQNFAILDMPLRRIVEARDVRVPLGNILIAFLHIIDPHGL